MKKVSPDEWKVKGWEPMSDAQRRLLNAACADLTQMLWHGRKWDKDSYRHFLAGVILGHDMVPSVDMGNGNVGFVSMARSSLDLNKTQATAAIDMAFYIGDDPRSQNIESDPVYWGEVVRFARGITDSDEELAERFK